MTDVSHLDIFPVTLLESQQLHLDVVLVLAGEIRNRRWFTISIWTMATNASLYSIREISLRRNVLTTRHQIRLPLPFDWKCQTSSSIILGYTLHFLIGQALGDRRH